jgi:P pilus assembly protein, porin PapC
MRAYTRAMKTIGLAACIAIAITTSVMGHHSFAAEFDGSKIQTIKGNVVEFQWMNPHAYLIVDVTDASGKTARWGVQSRNLSILKRQGLSKQTFKVGEAVTIELYHHHDPMKNVGFARYIQRADGTKYDVIPGGRGGIVPPNP